MARLVRSLGLSETPTARREVLMAQQRMTRGLPYLAGYGVSRARGFCSDSDDWRAVTHPILGIDAGLSSEGIEVLFASDG